MNSYYLDLSIFFILFVFSGLGLTAAYYHGLNGFNYTNEPGPDISDVEAEMEEVRNELGAESEYGIPYRSLLGKQ